MGLVSTLHVLRDEFCVQHGGDFPISLLTNNRQVVNSFQILESKIAVVLAHQQLLTPSKGPKGNGKNLMQVRRHCKLQYDFQLNKVTGFRIHNSSYWTIGQVRHTSISFTVFA